MDKSNLLTDQRKQAVGQYSGGLFLILAFTIIPYLMSIKPNYQFSLARFSAMTSLGTSSVTGPIFNPLLVFQGFLLLLYFNLYFAKTRNYYSQLHGWNAINRLQFLSAIGVAGVGLFPDSPISHAPHVIAAAFAFGASSFAIVIMSFNYFAFAKRDGMHLYRLMAIFGMILMVLGLSFTSIFIFINVNQGLWQTTQLFLLYVWYFLENSLYKKTRDQMEELDMKNIINEGLRNLRFAVIILISFASSLVILGTIGFIDMDILSKCENGCKPNITDYSLLFGFGIILLSILGVIKIRNQDL